ncbi:hypothetical protein SCANM63S_05495 [Streptomyces canarius]
MSAERPVRNRGSASSANSAFGSVSDVRRSAQDGCVCQSSANLANSLGHIPERCAVGTSQGSRLAPQRAAMRSA